MLLCDEKYRGGNDDSQYLCREVGRLSFGFGCREMTFNCISIAFGLSSSSILGNVLFIPPDLLLLLDFAVSFTPQGRSLEM